MMETYIPFKKIHIEKLSCSFTWDDNSLSHADIIEPVFKVFDLFTTFYIVPGGDLFQEKYAGQYSILAHLGHEIGSHTFSHPLMTTLSTNAAEIEFSKASNLIAELTGRNPSTFAFPHHDFNSELLRNARRFHLETRNTLNNAIRFSLKTSTIINDVRSTLHGAITNKENIVFSGHAMVSDPCMIDSKESGYEPITQDLLIEIIKNNIKNR